MAWESFPISDFDHMLLILRREITAAAVALFFFVLVVLNHLASLYILVYVWFCVIRLL